MSYSRNFNSYYKVLNSGCWQWNRSLKTGGYGRFMNNGFYEMAHRYSYKLFVGSIPKGLVLDHLCGNRGCVNPNHLEAVTQKENVLRSPLANKVCCPKGHKYRNNFFINTRGHRVCKLCHSEQQREYRQRRKLCRI